MAKRDRAVEDLLGSSGDLGISLPSPQSFNDATNDFYKPPVEGYDREVQREWPPSMCHQEFAEECDVNFIMRRYEETSIWPPVPPGSDPQYLDLSNMPTDLAETLGMLANAEKAFMTLPAKVRREFDNNPVAFVDYAANPGNLDQMREWGLAKPLDLPDAPRAPAEPAGSKKSPDPAAPAPEKKPAGGPAQ